jgi:hypothetical protein
VTDRRQRTVLGVSAAVVAALWVTACTAVPASGPVHAGEQTAQAQAKIGVAARPPVPGDVPVGIVSGFRFANSAFVGANGVAKAYLADGASWQPDQGVVVDADAGASWTTKAVGDVATVTATDTQVGTIAADGTFKPAPAGDQIQYGYQLTKDSKEKGQWRIVNAPPYLVLTVTQVEHSYQTGYVYFLRPDLQMLVPVRVFLPVSSDKLAGALLTTLLHPPPDWLSSAVTTAFPPGTVAPEPAQDKLGITTVDLSLNVANLPAARRSAIAAQLSYTLSNSATPLQNYGQLRIMAGGQPLISSQHQLQTAADWSRWDADKLKLGFYYSDVNHLTHDHLTELLPGDTGVRAATRLSAPVVAPHVDSSGSPDLIAGVVQGPANTESLYAGPLRDPKQLLSGSSFTTPSWDSLGNLWTVQQEKSSSAPQVRIAPTGRATLPPVAAPELANKVIKDLKVSRDGTRVAVLAVSTNLTQVLVGAVASDGTTIGHFYPVAPGLTSVLDFVWASSTQLDILVSGPTGGGGTASSALWTVDVDGWPPSLAEQTVLPSATSVAAAPGEPVVIGTANNQIEEFQQNNNTWQFVDGGSSPRYPG